MNLASLSSVWTCTRTVSTLPLRMRGATARCVTSFAHQAHRGGDLAALDKALRRLVSAGRRLHVVYEAGPCGFVIWRHLIGQGLRCEVVAPSSIARPVSERIKTDRRDAMLLARLARAGDLAVVRVPDQADEAVRDVVRAREDAVREQRNGRHRLKALLLRNGTPYAGKSSWTAAHLRWLATLKLPHPAQQIAMQEYLHSITECTARIGPHRPAGASAARAAAAVAPGTRGAGPAGPARGAVDRRHDAGGRAAGLQPLCIAAPVDGLCGPRSG